MRARAAAALACLAPALAAAEPPADSGLLVGVRAGYGLPSGDVARGGPSLRDVVDHKIPLALDLGYRFNPRVWGDLFLEIAPAVSAARACPSGVSCSASDVRFGLAAQFRLAPRARLDPWVGVGLGIEVMNADEWDPALSEVRRWTWAGFELPLAEAGLDLAISRRVSVGAYASAALAEFTSVSRRTPGAPTTSGAVDDRTSHAWLEAGLKATLRL